jgi:hypothetical protein
LNNTVSVFFFLRKENEFGNNPKIGYDNTIGVVLGQRIGKASHVIYYASRAFNDAQRNYSITEK